MFLPTFAKTFLKKFMILLQWGAMAHHNLTNSSFPPWKGVKHVTCNDNNDYTTSLVVSALQGQFMINNINL